VPRRTISTAGTVGGEIQLATCSTRAPRRDSAKVPSGLDTTAVPTFTTTRRAFDKARRSGTTFSESLSHARAEPAGKLTAARPKCRCVCHRARSMLRADTDRAIILGSSRRCANTACWQLHLQEVLKTFEIQDALTLKRKKTFFISFLSFFLVTRRLECREDLPVAFPGPEAAQRTLALCLLLWDAASLEKRWRTR
jgi:hypothetical protein